MPHAPIIQTRKVAPPAGRNLTGLGNLFCTGTYETKFRLSPIHTG